MKEKWVPMVLTCWAIPSTTSPMAGPDLPGNSNSRWTRLRQEQCPVAHDSIEVHRSWFQTKCLEFWMMLVERRSGPCSIKAVNTIPTQKPNPSPPNNQIPAEKGCLGKFSGVQIFPHKMFGSLGIGYI